MPNESSSPPAKLVSTSEHVGIVGAQRRGISRFSLLGVLLVMLLVCVGLILINEYGWQVPRTGAAQAPITSGVTPLLASDTLDGPGTLYLALAGAGSSTDLYRYDPASDSPPFNLTNSAGTSETWPVVSPDGSALAYFGVGRNGVAELYVMLVPDGLGTPITTKTAKTELHNGFEIDVSQPPVWSPNGTWLAFLALQVDEKGNAVELYVVRSDGRGLRNLTGDGNRIMNPVWLSDNRIAYVEIRGNGKATVYRRDVEQPPLVPTPVATLELPR